jgi:superfamily II DNA or RNA helicase
MAMNLSISPHGRLFVETAPDSKEAAAKRIIDAFADSSSRGILHLSTTELQASLPADFSFARDFGRAYLTQLCHTPEIAGQAAFPPVSAPTEGDLAAMVLSAPPMRGLEYLNADVLKEWWADLDILVRKEVQTSGYGVQEYLRERNPLWRAVGRVSFHLAENKRDPDYPFAFLASYSSRLSAQGRAQHLRLGRALQEYAGSKNRAALLSLLQPIHRAAERISWVKEMVEAGDIYSPLAWTPADAYRLLKDVPTLEESGLIVRVPDWWNASRPPRPVVSITVGNSTKISTHALLDFSVTVTFDGQPLDEKELRAILESSGGLVALKGKWVELDRDRLAEALKHWKNVERTAQHGGISFFEGMRMLSGANLQGDAASFVPEATKEWVGISAGQHLEKVLQELRHPERVPDATPPGLRTDLRPYQQIGVHWLRFMTRLGLGPCLADDMGLGKTIQVLALLLHLKHDSTQRDNPSLLIVPASLIANWKAEICRFAPSLSMFIAHPSETNGEGKAVDACGDCDLVITTYTMLGRVNSLRQREWRLVILDEAQAIKNAGTRQARAVKELRSGCRIALTGTPVENRLSDLWSLFDFLNPGLLGGAKAFANFVKQMNARESNSYGPLRRLVQPYILRRLKTDKRIISDLPEKTEVNAFCGLSKQQAALYQQSVKELAQQIDQVDGIQRRGIVLSYLMRLKQICNHPSQLTGDNTYAAEHSGKFQRLAEICEELAERQEKVLIFSQFREITAPLAEFLREVFGKPGLVLHGQTPVGKRRELVEAFQREDGPPFFVLSLKAGGTGLNLTAASYVIHFDRWWNPSVENQATDRAFRIGQKRNVFVHKFVCRGTVEDKIDELIGQKTDLSRQLLDGGADALLTEMSNDQLLRFVSLDINKAMES